MKQNSMSLTPALHSTSAMDVVCKPYSCFYPLVLNIKVHPILRKLPYFSFYGTPLIKNNVIVQSKLPVHKWFTKKCKEK